MSTNQDAKTMHTMYGRWSDDQILVPVSYDNYRIMMNEKFNLKFQMQKKDRCDHYNAWDNTKVEDRASGVRRNFERGGQCFRILRASIVFPGRF